MSTEFEEITLQQAGYANCEVEIDKAQSWVTISDRDHNNDSIFLQGHEAEDLIRLIETVAADAEMQDIPFNSIAESCASQLVECYWS